MLIYDPKAAFEERSIGMFFRGDVVSVMETGICCRAAIVHELAAGRNVRSAFANGGEAFIVGRGERLDAGDGRIFECRGGTNASQDTIDDA